MRFLLGFFLCLSLFNSCDIIQSKSTLDENGKVENNIPSQPAYVNKIIPINDSLQFQQSYEELLQQIKKDKVELLKGVHQNRISMDSVEHYFLSMMRDSVFKYWYGTPWEFNGHTDEPRRGEVACGYFISTPLKHTGLNVNRFKLAQQGAANIMKSVCIGSTPFRTTSKDKLKAHLDQQAPEGLYIIGLSFHVGYILRERGKNYVVHSSYFSPTKVCKEHFDTSQALLTSEDFYLGKLSMNHQFLKKWLMGERVEIVK